MTDALYFITLIANALKQANPKEALKGAFKTIETLGRQPQYQQGYVQFQRFMEECGGASMALVDLAEHMSGAPPTEPREIFFIIELDGREWHTVPVSRPFSSLTIKGLRPGHYTLLLDTGRLLWEGELTEKHLLWTEAFPDQPLALAADTGDVEPVSTINIPFLDGEWTLLVLPGLESGRMQLRPSKDA